MATYIRLTDYKSSDEKEQEFFNPENRYEAKQEEFSKIPSSPIAYWVSDKVNNLFEESTKLEEVAQPRQGVKTLNNDYFLKNWYEVGIYEIGFYFNNLNDAVESKKKWFPYNKGGSFRKRYGNNEFIVNWENDGFEMKEFAVQQYNSVTRTITNISYFFQEGLTWSTLSSDNLSVRYCANGFIFDSKGSMMFLPSDKILYMQSLLNSKMISQLLLAISPTLDFNAGALRQLPFLEIEDKNSINILSQQNINISKEEWDSRETSWDFTQNEILRILNDEFLMLNEKPTLEQVYNGYCKHWSEQFVQLHKNEEELNRLFIDIYELNDELDEYVEFEDITLLKNESKIKKILIPPHTIEEVEENSKTPEGYMYYRGAKLEFQADEIMKQFISYAVGVMLGRYSLDHEGLHITDTDVSLEEANAKFNIQTPTFEADDDNVIPILDGDWFTDDISERFLQFVKVTFGEEHYEENAQFIEDAIGKSLRKYFVKDFYADHVKRYKKRPIYWLFSSPKGSFQALIYMHRYKSDTVSVILNDYLRDYITKLEATKENLEAVGISASASKSEKTKALKEIEKIKKMLIELEDYEKDIMYPLATQKIEIDLDDGVKHNYPLFGKALKKVTGLS